MKEQIIGKKTKAIYVVSVKTFFSQIHYFLLCHLIECKIIWLAKVQYFATFVNKNIVRQLRNNIT